MQAEAVEYRVGLDGQRRKPNNNHHVVPLGILIVLCTVYLMLAGLQINYNHYYKTGVAAAGLTAKQNFPIPHLERSDLCRKMEIFKLEDTNDSITHTPNKRQQLQGNYVSTAKSLKSLKSTDHNRKKDNSKKTNTAEPIIYLFALVFIYLLLKAASDINQHYKSNKGDKRLRRCSLQSYAQKDQRSSHSDRRASKVAPLHTRHHLFTEGRSLSLDRYRFESAGISPKLHLRTHQAAANPHLVINPTLIEARPSRRLSVPISINYQPVNVAPIVHPELSRRGSVISLGSTADMSLLPGSNPTPLSSDGKRRVRMINRH